MNDPVPFLIAGVTLVVLGGVLLYYHRSSRALLDELWAVDTYEAKELKRMCRHGFNAVVEVQGVVSCDSPLISPAKGVECCCYHTTVEREDRRTRTVRTTDSHGRSQLREETYYTWVTDYNRTAFTPFTLTDRTGQVTVDPEGADIDLQQVCSRTIYHREPWFDGEVGFSNTGKYRITEEVFVADGYAFVHGQASCRGDDVVIGCPSEGYVDPKKKFFLITRRDEKELTHNASTTSGISFWFGVIALFVALFSFLCAAGVMDFLLR